MENQNREANQATALGIPFAEAKQMVNNYLDNLGRNDIGQFSNTVSVWYSLSDLNAMTAALNAEKAWREIHAPNEVTDGIRIYFANYGSQPPVGHEDYEDRNTLVFVSTHAVDGRPEKHQDYFESNQPSYRIEPQNRGGLCPPEKGCDCSSDIFNEENLPLCEFP